MSQICIWKFIVAKIMGQAQINVRTRACSRTSIARTRQAALTHNVRGKELKIHKKKVIALICVITKVYLQCQSNVSLENGKKDQSSEKQWHNIWSRFSSPKKTLITHIWCASSRSNDWCCVIAFQFFFFCGTLFNWHFNWHLHDFLSALDTKFLPIFEALVSHSRKTFF